MADIWDTLTSEQRAKLETGNDAYRVLKRGETIDRWYEAGVACRELQQAALGYAKTNQTTGRAYREAWNGLAEHVPDLRDMDKGARSHAIWMVDNWEAVSTWLSTLSSNQRLDLNHPRSVHRKYDAARKLPPPPNAVEQPSARIKLQDQLVELTVQLDAQRKLKTTGAIPPNMPMEELADMIADQHSVATVRRLIRALEARVEADERQDRIEAGRKGRKG
jgi:hypothetical protein